MTRDFWDKMDRSGGPDACWPWLLGKRGGRYGLVSRNGWPARSHRVAWELTNGPIPDGRLVLHRCDNPPCCNPAHLFLGSSADNAADRSVKGRTARQAGESNGQARVTAETVLAIRDAIASGQTFRGTAARFGVSVWHVQNIVARRRWAHLPTRPASRPGQNDSTGVSGAAVRRDESARTGTPDARHRPPDVTPRSSGSPSSSVTPAGAG